MRTIDVPVEGGNVVAWSSGTGRPAVILHGGPGMNDYTQPLAEELDGLFECIRYQQRGIPPTDAGGPYSVDQFIDDTIAVMDAVGWERPILIGHSWGGLLAQHVVAKHPGRASALVAIDSVGALGPDGGWDALDKALKDRLPSELRVRVAAAEEAEKRGEFTDADQEKLEPLVWPYYFSDPANAPQPPPFKSNNEVYKQIYASLIELFRQDRPSAGLRSSGVPAFYLHGVDDPVSVDAIKATVDFLPQAEMRLIDRCGHFPWLEKPGAVRTEVHAWLSGPGAIPRSS